METIIQAAIIGIVQGLTEFLPISSSAHLIVVPRALGWDNAFLNSNTFDVMLHMGTLVALLIYFARDFVRLIAAALASIRDRSLQGDPDRRLAWLILITVIPGALLGALLESFFDTFFRERLILIAVFVLIGAALLFLAERLGSKSRDLTDLRTRDAAVIGVAQAFALFPGISRSGITIATGLYLGLEREAAARFAFLMGTPIIAGAGLWKARTLFGPGATSVATGPLVVGMAAAAISGLIAIGFLLAYLRRASTDVFVAYRVLFAIAIVVLVVAGR